MRRTMLGGTVVAVLVLGACGGDEVETEGTSRGSVTPSAGKAREDLGRTATTPDDAAAMARSGALNWLPAHTLFALRMPSFSEIAPAFAKTALGQALGDFDAEAVPAGEMLEAWLAGVRQSDPLAADWLEVALDLQGEMVFAIPEVDPMSFAQGSPQNWPLTAALWLEVGDSATKVRSLLKRSAKDPRLPFPCTEKNGSWIVDAGPARIELRVEGTHLGICAAPTTEGSAVLRLSNWRALGADGFASRSLVATGQRPQTTVVEAYLHTSPIWPMLLAFAPAEAQQAIAGLGLDGIQGFSVRSGMHDAFFYDVAEMHTDGRDILSSMMGEEALDPRFADAIPAGATMAQVGRMDVGRMVDILRSRMPEDWNAEMDAGMAEVSAEMGMDLEQDLLANFGPHWLGCVRGHFDPRSPESLEFLLGWECRNADAVGSLVQWMGDTLGFEVHASRHESSGLPYRTIVTDDPSFPWSPVYTKVGDVLLVGSGPQILADAFATMRNHGGGAIGDRTASMPSGTWALSVQDTSRMIEQWMPSLTEAADELLNAAEAGSMPVPQLLPMLTALSQIPQETMDSFARSLPDFVTTVSSCPTGQRFEAWGPVPSIWAATIPMSIAAAVAIPNLMSARLDANEMAAIATLRNVASAQAQAMASVAVDRDQDGMGEAMSFAELAGAAVLPGRQEVLNPPLLSSSFQAVQRGAVERSGYRFRMFLPDAQDRPRPERDDGGSPGLTNADRAEHHWWACAWPQDAEQTGRSAMVITHTGEMFTTSATGFQAFDEFLGARPDDFLPASGTVFSGSGYTSVSGRQWWPVD